MRPLYIVTPTYSRPTQLPDLTRLANTLRLVPGAHWIVAEDANTTHEAVTELLEVISQAPGHPSSWPVKGTKGRLLSQGCMCQHVIRLVR